MSWEKDIIDYYNYLKLEKNVSNNTISAYISDIEKLSNFFSNGSSKSPKELVYNDIQSFLSSIIDQNLSARSQARYISSLKSFFDFLILENRQSHNPMELIESPKIGLKLPDTLSEKEINKLIQGIDLSHPQGHRNKAMLEMLYGCGLRVSELIHLRFSDLFLKDKFIRVLGKGNKERLVPIADSTIYNLELYTLNDRKLQKVEKGFEDYIFLNRRGRTLTRVMVFTIIKTLAQHLGLNKNISPHTFRHSFATHLLHNGADIRAIQLMLGHESITTTEIYTHIEQKHLQETILKFHPRNRES